jgi:hypothetical protein
MKTEPKEQAKPPFKVAIIDLIDAYHYADFFDDERYAWVGYQGYASYVDYDKTVALADRLFWALNPTAATQEDWTEWEAGFDVHIYDTNNACVYKAHEKLPKAAVKKIADAEIMKIVDEIMWSEKMADEKQLSKEELEELRADFIAVAREEKNILDGKMDHPNQLADIMREKITALLLKKFKKTLYPDTEEK